ncbi:hypothetical protein [Phyllobacterium zundukense]|uniref:Uncharacterized protein n=1 Tax=Phyllobacterium zundukense TaxID=1867719 RepID=A0A2N9VY76_9HYPH|nr:hypothetical protein [Phyllobacterium zundukense]ATU94082.1 hypothetical protein BLM14_20070 [Phyllobacterium zundukense]PIO44444.1 hypothetical protein B5P45_12860 [Phyllobacterium zundukense]
MGDFLDAVGISPFLMTVHYVPLLIAATVWSYHDVKISNWSKLADALGAFGVFLMLLMLPVFFDDGSGRDSGGAAQWFVIFSFLSLGFLPAASIAFHCLVGRLIGRRIKRLRA